MSASVPRVIPSSIISVDKRLFALCMAVRFLQGIATCIFIGAIRNSSVSSSDPISELGLALAAFATGAGAGFAFDRLLRLKAGLRLAAASALVSLTAGFLILWFRPHSETALIAALLLGVGVGGEFTAFGELARQALSSAIRWKGLRGWSTAYALGISVSLISLSMQFSAMQVNSMQFNAMALIAGMLSMVCLIGLLAVTVKKAECDERASDEVDTTICSSLGSNSCSSSKMPNGSDSMIQKTAPAEGDVPQSGQPSNAAASTAATATKAEAMAATFGEPEASDAGASDAGVSGDRPGEATECCGGSRQVRPTSFRQGVATSCIGWLIVLLSVSFGLEIARGSSQIWTLLAFASGVSIGYFMLFTVAPHSGYAVALLPFFLLGTISFVVALLLPMSSVGFGVGSFFGGLASGAVMCGCSAIVGELFMDRSTDSPRTRVITVSLFAASAVLLLFGVLQPVVQVRTISGMALGVAFVLGLIVIRALPNPIISNLGSSEAYDDADGELDDVMAAINS